MKQIQIQILHTCLLFVLGCVFSVMNVHAQTVTGTVTDSESGQTLPGVNVVVQGTTTGTVTDVEGEFSLNVPSLNETLVISYVGYQQQMIDINGRTTINVSLAPQVIRGEEMVVTAFGIQREQRSLSYSTQTVDTERFSEARELNVVNSLEGRVAGLNLSQSGSGVGSPTRIVLRGNRSIAGDSQPLYVIDGVPVRGVPTNLNPDNIASLDVLKGPNAAALYGSAAQDGVIIIETQRGERDQVNISVSNTFQLQVPDYYMDLQNEYAQGGGGAYSPSTEAAWGPRMEGQTGDHWSLDPADAGATYSLTPQGTDARYGVLDNGYSNASNITASMGTESSSTVFNYTYTDAQGIVPTNKLGRHNVSIRVNNDLSERLTLDSKLEYMQQTLDNRIVEGESNFNVFRQIYTIPPNIRSEHLANYEYTDAQGLLRHNYWNPNTTVGSNPYWMVYRNPVENKSQRVIGMTSLTFDVTDNVSVAGRASFDVGTEKTENRMYNDTFTRAEEGRYAVNKGDQTKVFLDAIASYSEDLTEDWLVSANVGASLERTNSNTLSANTGGALLVPNFFTLSNTSLPNVGFNPGAIVETQSIFAFGQIGWRDMVYLDVTGRNDWSSTLPADSRSYFYPSVGLSAILSDLIEMPEQISLARFRASYAQVGSSPAPFQLSRDVNFRSGGNSGFITLGTTLPNENLKPEQTESIELGLDLRLYQGRLGLDATWYKTNTKNQLFGIALPWGSGASSFFTNGGDVENKGIELMLNTRPVQNLNFSWDLDFQFSKNDNIVQRISDDRPRVEVGGDSYMRIFVVEEGKPFGEMYGRGFQRDDDGNILVNAAGQPLVTGGRTVRIGNASPDWRGSVNSTVTYQNVSLSFLISHRQGGDVTSFANSVLAGNGNWGPTVVGRDGGLILGDNLMSDETFVYAPNAPNAGQTNTSAISSEDFWSTVGGRNSPVAEMFTEDATSTRLREVTVGYRLPASLISQLPVSNIQVSLVGRNLFFIYRKSDSIEPDVITGTSVASEGFQSFSPPMTRSFGANVKIDF